MQQLPQDLAMMQPDTGATESMMRAILRLPEQQRIVCCLFYVERISLEEIAAVVDEPESRIAELFYLAHASVALDLGLPAPALAA
jgi:DNA-directed RNA polymerase specialized sigma24 family protein